MTDPTTDDSTMIPSRRLRYGPDATGRALAEWRDSLTFLYESVDPADVTTFVIDVALTQLPHAYLMDCSGGAVVLVRSENYAARAPVDTVVLFRLTEGRVVADYQGRETVLDPGDLVFIDYGLAQTSDFTAFRCAVVAMPRAAAPARCRSGDLHGLRIAAQSPLGRLLGHHVDALFATVAHLPVAAAEAAVGNLFALASAVWPDPGAIKVDQTPVMLDRALAVIDANLADPDLGSDQVCRALGVSRTTLYRLLAPAGGLGATILERRLDTAVLALLRETQRPGLVTQIAQTCGFRSSRHFIRSFRDRFGRTPAEVAALRVSDVGGGLFTDWFAAYAKEAGYDTVALWLEAKAAGS